MAIDTIGLASDFVDESVATVLERECTLRQGLDLRSGEILYQITTGELKGSYDHRICFRVERSRWQAVPKAQPVRVACEPYLYIEGSVHKAILGHNCYGGPLSFRPAAWWLIDSMMDLFQVGLPLADFWKVRRVDVSEVYELPSYESISEYFRGMNASDYPRREVSRFGLTGLYAPGRTTALKFYHKGPEFAKHDKPRLKKLFDVRELKRLQGEANKVLRVEVEVKTRKLEYDFGRSPLVSELQDSHLYRVFDNEVDRILREAKQMEIIREARAVEARLYEVYNSRLAGLLLGFWYRLAAVGEEATKKAVPKATFYRQRVQLSEAGCDWHASDVVLLQHSLIPQGFSLRRGSPWHLSGEHPKVTEQLSKYDDMPIFNDIAC